MKAGNIYGYRMPAWLQRFKKVVSSYWIQWFLGFVAGYYLAAVVAAQHWK